MASLGFKLGAVVSEQPGPCRMLLVTLQEQLLGHGGSGDGIHYPVSALSLTHSVINTGGKGSAEGLTRRIL